MDVGEALLSAPDSARHPWEQARLSVVRHLAARYVPLCTASRLCIADIGCGDLYVVRKLAKQLPGARFIGVDSELGKLDLHSDNLPDDLKHVELHADAVSGLDSAERAIDLVLLLDVLEHVLDETQFLAPIVAHRNIRPQTVFLVTVPAFGFLFSTHDAFLKHYRRYTVGSLTRRLRQAGLEPFDRGYFFFSLFMVRCVRRVLEMTVFANRPRNVRGVAGYRRKIGVDELAKLVLIADFRSTYALGILSRLIPGLSAYALCRRRQ